MNPASEKSLADSLRAIVLQANSAPETEREDLIKAIMESLGSLDMTTEVGSKHASLSDSVKVRFTMARWRTETYQLMLLLNILSYSSQVLVWSYLEGKLFKLTALADLLSDSEDELELRDHLVYWYIESRAEWFQFNCRINYTTIRGVTPDPLMIAQASICSKIIEAIEKLFEEKEIELLSDFISAPLPNCEMLDKLVKKVA